MESLLLLLVCALLGILTARVVHGSSAFVHPLNWWVLNIALPALVLELIPKLEFGWYLWFLPVSQWLVLLGSWIFCVLMGRALQWSRRRIGGLTLIAGLGNTMFIGYPFIEAILGRDALPAAVVADQAGAFLGLTIGGVIIVALYSGLEVANASSLAHAIWRRLIRFPAVHAIIVGVVVGALGGWPLMIDNMLLRLGATLTPLALFSAGLQFRLYLEGSQRGAVALALMWKLALAPVVVALLGFAVGVGGMTFDVGVLQAAMPPMIAAAIMASQYDLEPDLVNTVLALGILLSILTLPIAVLLI